MITVPLFFALNRPVFTQDILRKSCPNALQVQISYCTVFPLAPAAGEGTLLYHLRYLHICRLNKRALPEVQYTTSGICLERKFGSP